MNIPEPPKPYRITAAQARARSVPTEYAKPLAYWIAYVDAVIEESARPDSWGVTIPRIPEDFQGPITASLVGRGFKVTQSGEFRRGLEVLWDERHTKRVAGARVGIPAWEPSAITEGKAVDVAEKTLSKPKPVWRKIIDHPLFVFALIVLFTVLCYVLGWGPAER